MRIKEMITDLKSFWLLNKFSLSAREEIYGELYEEYALWCWGVKGLTYTNELHLDSCMQVSHGHHLVC